MAATSLPLYNLSRTWSIVPKRTAGIEIVLSLAGEGGMAGAAFARRALIHSYSAWPFADRLRVASATRDARMLAGQRKRGGAVVIETVFAWPGLGRLAYDAVLRRDQPVIMALTLLTSLVIIGANLLVDMAYVVLDPRISYVKKA